MFSDGQSYEILVTLYLGLFCIYYGVTWVTKHYRPYIIIKPFVNYLNIYDRHVM